MAIAPSVGFAATSPACGGGKQSGRPLLPRPHPEVPGASRASKEGRAGRAAVLRRQARFLFNRHSDENRNPEQSHNWIPASAGMTATSLSCEEGKVSLFLSSPVHGGGALKGRRGDHA